MDRGETGHDEGYAFTIFLDLVKGILCFEEKIHPSSG